VLRAPTTVANAPRTVTRCDAIKLRVQANDRVNLGQHAAALSLLERALVCKPGDMALIRLAFMSACNAHDQAKAKKYFRKLSAGDQPRYQQVCIRNMIDVDDGAPADACDADKLKEQGMVNINMGQHAAALAQFEASLKCKPDPYVLQLAFMEACASRNEAKANVYYPQLSPRQREKFRQICIRQTPSVRLYIDELEVGYLHVTSKPVAKILIDGKDTELETPIKGKDLKLTPGKHKVTFVIGEDRFTYPVVIEAGKTATMTKDLQ
jgi:tetratricopeptide (TPR) repeat protein